MQIGASGYTAHNTKVIPFIVYREAFKPSVPLSHKKAANIHAPVRLPAGAEIQRIRDLFAKLFPGTCNIAAPDDAAVTLLPAVTGTGQVSHARRFLR